MSLWLAVRLIAAVIVSAVVWMVVAFGALWSANHGGPGDIPEPLYIGGVALIPPLVAGFIAGLIVNGAGMRLVLVGGSGPALAIIWMGLAFSSPSAPPWMALLALAVIGPPSWIGAVLGQRLVSRKAPETQLPPTL